MSELEKKFINYQESECDTQPETETFDERYCPTCIPDPSFKLEDKWHKIKKAYLDKSVCEYRVRIYSLSGDNRRTESAMIDMAINKIIVHAKKVLNNEARKNLKRSAYVVKYRSHFNENEYFNENSDLGKAYLIGVPSFAVDQIPSLLDETGEQDEDFNPESVPNEVIVPFKDLNQKLVQLAGALRVYEIFYANTNILKENAVSIVEKNNPIKRFSYELAANNVKKFRQNLSDVLRDNNYVELFEILSVFQKNVVRPKSLKFIFDNSNSEKPYNLKEIYAHVEGCEEYEKIDIDESSVLLGSSMETVYHFIANLDKVINDITAQETKPWLEFTLDNIYPDVIADYGDASAFTDEDYVEFGCLLENSFGIGKGQLANTIYDKSLSYFKSLENELYKEACRSINESSTSSTTSISDEDISESESDNLRAFRVQKRKSMQEMVDLLNTIGRVAPPPVSGDGSASNEVSPDVDISSENVLSILVTKGDTMYGLAREYLNTIQEILELNPQFDPGLIGDWSRGESPGSNDKVGNINRNPNWIYPKEELKVYDIYFPEPEDESNFLASTVEVVEPEYTMENLWEKMKENDIDSVPVSYKGKNHGIGSEAQLDALLYALLPEPEVEDDREKHPHKKEIKKAWNESFEDSNTIIGLIKGKDGKDGTKFEDSNFWLGTINIVGLCGISKLASKALQCLLGGATINQFYDAVIDKFFEFLEFNTLDLFLGSLPYSFRSDLDKALSEQFGSSVSLTDMLNIKKQDNSKVRDVVNYGVVNQMMKIFEKSADPLVSGKTSQLDKELIRNNLGDGQLYIDVSDHFNFNYGPSWGWIDEETEYDNLTGEGKKTYKPKKYAKKLIKHGRRAFLKGNDSFDQSKEKLKNTLDLFGERNRGDSQKLYNKELNSYERTSQAMKKSNIGNSMDVVFDLIFDFTIDYIIDSLSVDILIEQIANYPAGDWLIGFVTDFFKSCPHPSLFDPPVKDFMKSFSLDVCDPEVSLTLPSLQIPNISLRYNIDNKFGQIFKKTILDAFTEIVVGLIKRLANLLEDALCKSLEAIGRFAEKGIKNNNLISNALDNFQSALDEAFCGGSTNPQTGKKRAEELAESLFRPFMDNNQNQISGFGNTISNIVSGIASQREIMELMTDGNEEVEEAIANAVSELYPEMSDALGSQEQVSYFFTNLGSYLSEDDKNRIRDILAEGGGNLPTSASVCLTSEQLNAWNDVRRAFFENRNMSPEEIEEAIGTLNGETEDAIESILEDISEINSEGPFTNALSNAAMSDLCNPNNILNTNSKSQLDKQEMEELVDDIYANTLRLMKWGFFNPKSGIIINALRDVNNSTQIKRRFLSFFNPNYMNSIQDQINDFDNSGLVRTFIKNSMSEDNDGDGYGDPVGIFPNTVAGFLRQGLLENKQSELSRYGITYSELTGIIDTVYFESTLSIEDLDSTSSFSHTVEIEDSIVRGPNVTQEDLLVFEVPKQLTQSEREFLAEFSVYPETNNENLRLSFFTNFMRRKIPTLDNKNYENLYNSMFEFMMSNSIEAFVTNDTLSDGIPLGFKYGYVSEDLDPDVDLIYYNPDGIEEYNLDPEEKILGTYKNDRIKVLSPEIYGGSYSNPVITIEQRKFFGWLEYALKAFDTSEGCDPKNPPMLSLDDIKDRVKFLDGSLRDYPELTEDPECRIEVPFKLLVDSGIRANIEGVVRTTLRSYLGEYFLKSIGLFSNVHIRPENIDLSFMLYCVESMKKEMLDLGTSLFSNKISIKKEKYWYTFLEQSVQVYANMVELGEVTPPPHIASALEEISLGQNVYSRISRETRKSMVKRVERSSVLTMPRLDNRHQVIADGAGFGLLSILFRLSPQEERDSFLSGGQKNIDLHAPVTPKKIKRASLKKLNFFSKILFIGLFEEECKLILAELLSLETSRLSNNAFEGLNDKPHIFDISKAFVGFKNIFQFSTSQIGLGSYYLEKQFGTATAGSIAVISDSNASFSKDQRENPEDIQFVVEAYARVIDKDVTSELPPQVSLRSDDFRGHLTLEALESLVASLPDEGQDKHISDYFGNLSFLYKSSFEKLYNNGLINQTSVQKIIDFNPSKPRIEIESAYYSLVIGSDNYSDIDVFHDSSFILEGEELQPVSIDGISGIKYGIRICALLPDSSFSSSELLALKADADLIQKSRVERAYLFEDEKFLVPLVEAEVDLIDAKLSEISTSSGKYQYDLECMVNKLVEQDEFKMLFHNIFPLKTFCSSAAIYCSRNFMPSLGRGENERDEDAGPLIKSEDDDWDGTSNTFLKNFLRQQFQSFYLANSVDGFGSEGLNDRERYRFFENFNPFSSLSLPSIRIPWFMRRKIETKVYDANGEECADPLKDLE